MQCAPAQILCSELALHLLGPRSTAAAAYREIEPENMLKKFTQAGRTLTSKS